MRTPPPRTLADDVTSTVVTAIGEPQATAKIDVSDQMFGDVAEGDGLPGVFGWADAPPAMDDTRRALDELTRQMAEVTGRRLEELSALDDLEQLALRDGRDVIVFARDGKIEDAQITVRSDDPTVYLVDAAALDLRPVDGRTGPPGWLTGVRYLR